MAGGKAVRRMYEKNVKGYVYCIGGGPGHKMQLPKDERRGRAFSRASPNVVLRLRLRRSIRRARPAGTSNTSSPLPRIRPRRPAHLPHPLPPPFSQWA